MSRIFISYRRAETAGTVGRLYDRLVVAFGEENIFLDVDDLNPGIDFAREIEEKIASCQVLIAVIGSNWLNIPDKTGRPRLENPQDLVRLEIAAALRRDILIIPVLDQGTEMPGADQLPDDLKPMATRNAIILSHQRFNDDANRIVRAILNYLPVGKLRIVRPVQIVGMAMVANLYLDGAEIGLLKMGGSLQVEIFAGKHRLQALASGFLTFTDPSSSETLEFELEPGEQIEMQVKVKPGASRNQFIIQRK